jgi:hypothetical protein
MRIKPSLIIPQTITVVNKLKGKDNATSKDIYYKKVLKDCVWNIKSVMNQNGTNISFGKGVSVQIPKDQEYTFMPYNIWKLVENLEDCFTLSLGDYIFLGEIVEEVTSQNISALIQQYKSNVIQIKDFSDYTLPDAGYSFRGGFLFKYASIYVVEGE